MQTIKITTSQNIDIDYAVAGLGDRIVAWIIDYAIFLGVYLVCFLLIAIFISLTHFDAFTSTGFPLPYLVGIIIWVVLFLFYDLLCEIFMNGQSFGKKIMKIKVISLNGARPRVGQYLLRWLFRIVDIGLTTGSAAVVCIALTDNKQRIGDVVAGTAVISMKPEKNFAELVFGPPPADYQLVYSNVLQLTDADVVLIYDVIRNFNRTRNNMLIYRLAIQLKKYLDVSYDNTINEYQFLEILLNDYKTLSVKTGI